LLPPREGFIHQTGERCFRIESQPGSRTYNMVIHIDMQTVSCDDAERAA
jgi:hypothetical protein